MIDGPLVDGPLVDGPPVDTGPDGPGAVDTMPGPDGPLDRKSGEVTGGAAISTGGGYTLRSQVGHAVSTQTVSGGAYVLRWNAAVIPW